MNNPNPILLILDVDETLIYATEKPLERSADHVVGQFYVYRRPHLTEFLVACQKSYRLAVWSSSSDGYLQGILRAILPSEVQPEFVWSRERCVPRLNPESWTTYFVKDLKKVKRLGFDLRQVLIVDDSPEKVERNYGNAIYVQSYLGATDDDELLKLARYLDRVRSVRDVRAEEKRGWRLEVS